MGLDKIFKVILLLLIMASQGSMEENLANAAQIILDPGHGPSMSGAISCTGEKEYKYNDQLVKAVKSALDRHNLDSEITRKPNQNMSLLERIRNTKDAQLFISLHHDSVQPQFVSQIDGKPTSTRAQGYSLFVSRKNRFFKESLRTARLIAQNLYRMGLRPSKHHGEKIKGENREPLDERLGIYAFDDLVVLKNSQCPALLVEAGVIVNPEDEKLVRTQKYKQQFSRAIANALTR